MSLIAGAVARDPGGRLGAEVRAELRAALARPPAPEPAAYEDPRTLLLQLDFGAFESPAFRRSPSGAISILAGEPLLHREENASRRPRADDLATLQEHLERGDPSLLRQAHGIFSLAHLDPAGCVLHLATDKIGLRPLYVWFDDRIVVFASALRVLESMRTVPKVMDVRAVTEEIAHGFPLGRRTPYHGILTLDAGEILRLAPDHVASDRYWRWEEVRPSSLPEVELLDRLYLRFQAAVERRVAAGDRTVRAGLSGGLDSRCVVAALRERRLDVHAYTFALRGSQDDLYSERFARAAGVLHHPRRLESPTVPGLGTLLRETLSRSEGDERPPVDRPAFLWSGDGGSVGLGYAYMSPELVSLLRRRRREEAARLYLARRGAGVRSRILRPEVRKALESVLVEGIVEELDRVQTDDPARAFPLFLLQNDQRRHLASHFEEIDRHRIEFQLPFFDSEFLEAAFAAPVDSLLGHRLYHRWLERFPKAVRNVPWQAYPGHEPCPVPDDTQALRQWDPGYDRLQARADRPAHLRATHALIEAADFPPILSRTRLRIAALLHRVSMRDSRHLMTAAELYARYWWRSGGRCVLPDGTRLGKGSA